MGQDAEVEKAEVGMGRMNANEFVEFCRKCERRKSCHYQGCILDEKGKVNL